MEEVVTNGAISRAKLQSNHHHQQTNSQFFYRPDALPFAQPTMSKHWREISHPMDLHTPNSPGGLPTLSLTSNISWLPWWRFAMPLISPLMPVFLHGAYLIGANGLHKSDSTCGYHCRHHHGLGFQHSDTGIPLQHRHSSERQHQRQRCLFFFRTHSAGRRDEA